MTFKFSNLLADNILHGGSADQIDVDPESNHRHVYNRYGIKVTMYQGITLPLLSFCAEHITFATDNLSCELNQLPVTTLTSICLNYIGDGVDSCGDPASTSAPTSTENLPPIFSEQEQEIGNNDSEKVSVKNFNLVDGDKVTDTSFHAFYENERVGMSERSMAIDMRHYQQPKSANQEKAMEKLAHSTQRAGAQGCTDRGIENRNGAATDMTSISIDESGRSVDSVLTLTHPSDKQKKQNETTGTNVHQSQQDFRSCHLTLNSNDGQQTENEAYSIQDIDDAFIKKGVKRRLLALHGKRGNNQVTQTQLENLLITQDRYDIVYFHGHITEVESETTQVERRVGPLYSWSPDTGSEARCRTSILRAAGDVLKAINTMGPFDVIYGFGQGATIATVIASACSDTVLREEIIREVNKTDPSDEKIQNFESLSLRYVILACASQKSELIASLQRSSIQIPSMHLIGKDDPSRSISEEISDIFADVQIQYMNSGNFVDESVRRDKSLLRSLHFGLFECNNIRSAKPPVMTRVSQNSTIGVMQDIQAVNVEVDRTMDDPTITSVLESRDVDRPFLYNAREIDSCKHTTYGDVLSFIRGGPGDLRRLGVNTGEVVAYCAPAGATAALAFLSIAAQTTAAPLGPSDTESGYVHLLETFDAKHVIIFDDVECSCLKSAVASISRERGIKLHKGKCMEDEKPGWFELTTESEELPDAESEPPGVPLLNPSDGLALLLSTSGTTSRAKGVPLLHGSVVRNGQLIASSLGLLETDICYNIMPLFHIGGISSSILGTMTSGGAICCDNETYEPENMVDALALSDPQPTWYTAVPSIHNTTVSFIKNNAGSMKLDFYGVNNEGVWKEGHSLRFIRSGAAALLSHDAKALAHVYGNIPVYPTYSMSEQMPITQPPNGKYDMIFDKEGSVGVPISASLAIVDNSNLNALPYGQIGEIAISGSTVMTNYLDNPEANEKAYFKLVLPTGDSGRFISRRFFLTGDTGLIDNEGFLTLKGRNKELIKKSGEQISPFEIEEVLLSHFWVDIAICFSVPSELYGEEVGCALVLSPTTPPSVDINEVTRSVRELLWSSELCPSKWPTKWKIVNEEDLPQTKSKKYIRIGLSTKLGLGVEGECEEMSTGDDNEARENNAYIDWDTLNGLRFVLACYVMFMHVGSNESWGVFNLLRGFPWHVHCFFTLGGFSMAAPMSPSIDEKFKYFLARIGNMYPMYVVSVIFTFINLLISCRPSTFRPEFHWSAQPDDLYIDGNEENGLTPMFCEGTPITPNSYWASLSLTIIVYILGLTITPVWVMHWWMGFYFWFASMYYQCLMIFPHLYNLLLKWRGQSSRFLWMTIFLMGVNYIILFSTWVVVKDARGYEHYDTVTGEKNAVNEYNENAFWHNSIVLGWFLFSPFWMLYFIIGSALAFLYDAYRPLDKIVGDRWGLIADGCTVAILSWSICVITQGQTSSVEALGDTWYLRPREANHPYLDNAATNRIWDSIHGRIITPLTTLWIFSLSTGKGVTASALRIKFLAKRVSPHAYNCFLFHQMVCQWYFSATRRGQWWSWWQYRKTMYWFSPHPVPVQWYEYFVVVILTVAFSSLMQVTLEPIASSTMICCKRLICKTLFPVFDITDLDHSVHHAIEDLTGLSPESQWTLGQSGLSSVGLPQLATRLGNVISSKELPLSITARELSHVETVGDIVKALEVSIHKKQYDLTMNASSHRTFGDILSKSFHRKKYDIDNNDDIITNKPRRSFSDLMSRSVHRQKYDIDQIGEGIDEGHEDLTENDVESTNHFAEQNECEQISGNGGGIPITSDMEESDWV